MAEAKRDQNSIPSVLGVSNADGVTPIVVWVDPTTHRLLVSSSGPIDSLPTTPITYNVAMTLANTEYSQLLPDNTRKLDIKLRATGTMMKVAFVSTESATNYMTVAYGASLHLENVDLTGVTIYFQSPTASQVAEILCFT